MAFDGYMRKMGRPAKHLTMLAKVADLVIDAAAVGSGLLVHLLWVIVSYEVIIRYVLKQPTTWATDFSGYFLFYLTFLGIAWVLKQDGHVSIDILTSRLGPTMRAYLYGAASLFCACLSAILFVFGVTVTLGLLRSNEATITVLRLPLWPLYAVFPIGTLLLTIQFLRRSWGSARSAPGEWGGL